MKKISNYLAAGIYMVLAVFAGIMCIAYFVIVSNGNIWGLFSGAAVAAMIVAFVVTVINDSHVDK